MFEISGVFDNKFYPNGQVSRLKRMFKTQLNSEEGVIRFVEEQRPFTELKIIEFGVDKTQYFLDKIKTVEK